ncbi:MAG: YebC/PmpR family DNA-binding transcriptional regulator, partial [Bacteroidetes bacterium]|nr:YebC/PmpR family DNA-binding transcriptional regulator [Bacteroidota bacterium]
MSGHSKWANIKHRKAKQDAKRSKAFTGIIKSITMAARDGGGDPNFNPSLRLAIQNAKGVNMPKDTIEKAIKKGAGGEGANLQNVTYEGYATGGIAIFVEATTDNPTRTVANVRAAFNKYNGNLGTNGSLSFIFDQKGIFEIDINKISGKDKDEFELELIEIGAEDIDWGDETIEITSSFEDFGKMQKEFEERKIEVQSAKLERIPKSTNVLDTETALKVFRLIDKLEDDDDVTMVYHNLELTDELEKE